MISFSLRCREAGHRFEGWFRSSEDFEAQAGRGVVHCPVCGSGEVGKALMAPAVASGAQEIPVATGAHPPAPEGASQVANGAAMAEAFAKLQAVARHLRANAENVGPRFAEEARKIHYGETDHRQIYGEASKREVDGLREEGIVALPLPPLPEDAN